MSGTALYAEQPSPALLFSAIAVAIVSFSAVVLVVEQADLFSYREPDEAEEEQEDEVVVATDYTHFAGVQVINGQWAAELPPPLIVGAPIAAGAGWSGSDTKRCNNSRGISERRCLLQVEVTHPIPTDVRSISQGACQNARYLRS